MIIPAAAWRVRKHANCANSYKKADTNLDTNYIAFSICFVHRQNWEAGVSGPLGAEPAEWEKRIGAESRFHIW